MQRLRYTLPPPNLIITFEAAGRLLSFTRAASELNVSRVAVSQQIKALEEYLDVKLFHRMHRALLLTAAGEKYHRAIALALEQILHATSEVKRAVERNLVTVTASSGFATYWLMPNIGSFQKDHPEIELRFVISDRYLNLIEENIDVAVRYGTPPFPNVSAEHLAHEVIAPTCAPSLLNGSESVEPDEVSRYRLIHLEGPYDEQTRWSNWFRVQDLDAPPAPGRITVNTYTNLVQAALDGQGFALIGTPLIDRYLQSGALVQPVRAAPVTRRSFYVATPTIADISDAADTFRSWLIKSFKERPIN